MTSRQQKACERRFPNISWAAWRQNQLIPCNRMSQSSKFGHSEAAGSVRGSRCPTVLDRCHGKRGRNRLRHCARKIWAWRDSGPQARRIGRECHRHLGHLSGNAVASRRVERFSFRTPSRNGNGRVDMALSASSVGQKLRYKGASKCQNISFRDPIRAKV